MKQLLSKLKHNLRGDRRPADKSSVPRITNDTLAEHREQVISKGKRYKYPMQQTKHRTVLISSAIVVLLVASLSFFTWWQLYRAQDSSQFFYRVTQILPLTIGNVDGEQALYRDYLLELRSSLHFIQNRQSINLDSDDGQKEVAYHKRRAMNTVLEQVYTEKLAGENNIRVTNKETDEYINEQIVSSRYQGRAGLDAVVRDFYDWSFEEYHQITRKQLLKQKVVAAIDAPARERAQDVLRQARRDPDEFAALARKYSEEAATRRNGGDVGFVAVDNPDRPDPDGLAAAAAELRPGRVSNQFVEGAEGLYVIKLLEKRGAEVRFARIFIGYKEFDRRLGELRQAGKVKEHINIPPSAEVGLDRQTTDRV